METAGHAVSETDPFCEVPVAVFESREPSPYVNRLKLMWATMRSDVLENFPAPPGLPRDVTAYLKRVDDLYTSDAYNSLSIEGYRVSAELLERVRAGNWNPDENEDGKANGDALAACGYWQAFQSVKASLASILRGESPGSVVQRDHDMWHGQLFGPSVTARLLTRGDLAGFRNGPVFIRRSMHVPPSCEAVRELMPVFFELLDSETEASVRVVLGHYTFVYIHPYMDGNGRIGRFLMNAMMAAGGYPWTIVPVTRRAEYIAALESASVDQCIKPFSRFLGSLSAAQN
jgi:hypothetical protein